MEKVKGYVYPPSLQRYRNGSHEGLYVWSKPRTRWGITGIHVTLSPVQSRDLVLKPWQIDLLSDLSDWLTTPEGHTTDPQKIKEKIDQLFAKHTPQKPEGSLECPWVRVKAVKSGICIVCHKRLLYHNLSELGDCRRDARRKFDKLEHGLREIRAHIETVIDIEVKKIEAKHTPQGDQTGVKKE